LEKIILLVISLFFVSFGFPHAEAASKNHVLAIGICPPWKKIDTEVCRRSTSEVSAALEKHLGIAPTDVTSIVNEQATANGLKSAMLGFSGLGPSDRLIIYANLHAGALDPTKEAGPNNDVFVTWTKDKPKALAFAVVEGDWIMARDFAAWVHAIPAGEIIVIIDACESGAVSPLFVERHPDNDPHRPEAVIVSSGATQFANFTQDQRLTLYTQQLLLAINSGLKTLESVFERATTTTVTAAVPICAAERENLLKSGLDPSSCLQIPETHDPDGLLKAIVLQ
jgi:hypothetical protein